MVAETFIAEIVHGYLKDKNYVSSADVFMQECDVLENNQTASEVAPCLDNIVKDYFSYVRLQKECSTKEVTDIVQSLWKQLDATITQLRLLTLKKTLPNSLHTKTFKNQAARSRSSLEQYQNSRNIVVKQKQRTNFSIGGNIVRFPEGGQITPKTVNNHRKNAMQKLGAIQSTERSTQKLLKNASAPTSVLCGTSVTKAKAFHKEDRKLTSGILDNDPASNSTDISDVEFSVQLISNSKKTSKTNSGDIDAYSFDGEKVNVVDSNLETTSHEIDNSLLQQELPTNVTTSVNKPIPPGLMEDFEVSSATASDHIDSQVTNDTGIVPSIDPFCTPVKNSVYPGLPTSTTKSPKRKSVNPKRSAVKENQNASIMANGPHVKNLNQPADELNQLIDILLNDPNLQERIAENINKAVESVHHEDLVAKESKNEVDISKDINLNEVINLTTNDPSFEELLNMIGGGNELTLASDILPVSIPTDRQLSASQSAISHLRPSITPEMIQFPNTTSSADSLEQQNILDQPMYSQTSSGNSGTTEEIDLQGVAMDALLMLANCQSPCVPEPRGAVRNSRKQGFVPISEQPTRGRSPINVIHIPDDHSSSSTRTMDFIPTSFGGFDSYVLKGKTEKLTRKSCGSLSRPLISSKLIQSYPIRRNMSEGHTVTSSVLMPVTNDLVNVTNSSITQPVLTTVDLSAIRDDTAQTYTKSVNIGLKAKARQGQSTKRPKAKETKTQQIMSSPPKKVPKHLNVDEFLSRLSYD